MILLTQFSIHIPPTWCKAAEYFEYYYSSIPLYPSPPVEPTGKVSNLSVSLAGNADYNANISWSPLSPGDWNGVPYRYYVSSSNPLSMKEKCLYVFGNGGDKQILQRNVCCIHIPLKLVYTHKFSVSLALFNSKKCVPQTFLFCFPTLC